MAILKFRSMVALATVACGVVVSACSGTTDQSNGGVNSTTGTLDMNLVAAGNQLDSVTMNIYTGTAVAPPPVVTNTFSVTSPNALIKAFAGALDAPAAHNNYFATFTATGPGVTCSGGQLLDILPNTKTTATVQLTCTANSAAPPRGSVEITGQVVNNTACPYLKNTSIAPLQTDVGQNVTLGTDVSAASTVVWSHTSDGTLVQTGFNGVYTCVTAGTKTITVTITKPGTACSEAISEDVICVGATGAGGATGSGGASAGGASAGGASAGGASAGGASAGGASAGGASAGGASAGGATSDGGAGNGGAGNGGGGAGGGDLSCVSPGHPATQVADTATCLGCESDNCTADVAPGCTSTVLTAAQQTACQSVLSCIRSTNCITGGDVFCYCGAADIASCKATPAADGTNPANGACKAEITAAYGSNDPANIVNNIGVLTIPTGAALALGRCDWKFCNSGSANECVPYCQ